MPFSNKIKVAARDSTLSRAQVEEAARELGLAFEPTFVKTYGDFDRQTSLRTLDKTDFFTREVDALVLNGTCRFAIHSAKDLPDPLPAGLRLWFLTQGVDSRDALVYKALPKGAKIGTSSQRREENARCYRKDLTFVDIRGTIEERLEKIERGELDGVIVAEAALIRLKLNPQRIYLPGETAPLQGRLAILERI